MRSYPHNSPQAAARIVALTMLADGHLSHDEFMALEHHQMAAQLGLLPSELMEVLYDCCEDLQSSPWMTWDEVCRVSHKTLTSLLDEISDPVLQQRVLQCCEQLSEADNHVAEGEAVLLATAAAWWNLPHVLPRPDWADAPRAAA